MSISKKIQSIRNESGNAKIQLLSNTPELKEILEWTYNPFKKYYMTPEQTLKYGDEKIYMDDGHLVDNATRILNDLSSRELSGNKAISVVKEYMETLNLESQELFFKIILKDLRCGISINTINKVFPGLIPKSYDEEDFPVMFVKNVNYSKIKSPSLVAPKLDGVRARFYGGKFYSRQKKELIGLDHISEALIQFCEPRSIPLDFDGELTVPGDIFDDASGLIRNKKPVPEARYNIFDCPGIKLPKMKRLDYMLCQLFPFENELAGVHFIIHDLVYDDQDLEIKYQEYLEDGEEGIVIYDPDSEYEYHTSSKRSYSWMRIVPIKNADCCVVGFFEGKGKFENTLGGIIIEYGNYTVRVGTGFSDDIRQLIWNNKSDYFGKIAEIEFKEETKAGSMRQPRFKCFREDKTEPNFS